jgi:hypothetical protein
MRNISVHDLPGMFAPLIIIIETLNQYLINKILLVLEYINKLTGADLL